VCEGHGWVLSMSKRGNKGTKWRLWYVVSACWRTKRYIGNKLLLMKRKEIDKGLQKGERTNERANIFADNRCRDSRNRMLVFL